MILGLDHKLWIFIGSALRHCHTVLAVVINSLVKDIPLLYFIFQFTTQSFVHYGLGITPCAQSHGYHSKRGKLLDGRQLPLLVLASVPSAKFCVVASIIF
jgi:hypothetical protein